MTDPLVASNKKKKSPSFHTPASTSKTKCSRSVDRSVPETPGKNVDLSKFRIPKIDKAARRISYAGDSDPDSYHFPTKAARKSYPLAANSKHEDTVFPNHKVNAENKWAIGKDKNGLPDLKHIIRNIGDPEAPYPRSRDVFARGSRANEIMEEYLRQHQKPDSPTIDKPISAEDEDIRLALASDKCKNIPGDVVPFSEVKDEFADEEDQGDDEQEAEDDDEVDDEEKDKEDGEVSDSD